MTEAPKRTDRFYRLEEDLSDHGRRHDTRTIFQHDRDRLLHCSSFLRLDRVTQVVSPIEGNVFHNRLTHSLKVAQVGRRIAERLLTKQPEQVKRFGGLNPDVVEAACLAHDLGHPPFGHIAEKTLNKLIKEHGVADGYEGNAQSFRIICKLSLRRIDSPGLNLARATLNAVLKYPWLYGENEQRLDKWGAYSTEREIYEWARELGPARNQPSIEAAIMDWSDDIAYSVHDLEDFYRAGLIPLDRLVTSSEERERFLNQVFEMWNKQDKKYNAEEYLDILDELFTLIPIDRPFDNSARQRGHLRTTTSALIDRFVRSIQLSEAKGRYPSKRVIVESQQRREVTLLKQVTWQYVIDNPALARQQHGKAKIVKDLFKIYMDAIKEKDKLGKSTEFSVLPVSCRERIESIASSNLNESENKAEIVRAIADTISSMTDYEALRVHQQLTGVDPGSITDHLLL